MSIVAYFDCYSGASGDMILGSMLDKAVDFIWLKEELNKLNLPENLYKIEKTYTMRSNINTCKINIELLQHEHHHRGYSEIYKILEDSTLDEKVKKLAQEIFLTLAEAEATVHKKTIENIHFHEVGAIDAIIDITGFSIAYNHLQIDKSYMSPIPIGSGQIKCAHGTMPVPAPATVEILKNKNISTYNHPSIKEECLTPTAAAILGTVVTASSGYPEMNKILNSGYGAGNKIFSPDVTSNLRFIVGEKI